MGLRINEVLTEKGISIAELGRRINKSRSSLHATLEKGNPQYSTLVEIAKALDVKVWELMTDGKNDSSDINGFIEYKNQVYKISSITDLENLLSELNEASCDSVADLENLK